MANPNEVAREHFEPILAYHLRRMSPRPLAAFKYLVEHGEPPKVKHAKLPSIPIAC